jgi:transcriptional regulator with XRE-family HTH domain
MANRKNLEEACISAQKFLKKRGMTYGPQTALAEMMGVTQQTVSEWVKRGWMPPAHALKAQRLMGIPAVDLVKPIFKEVVEATQL